MNNKQDKIWVSPEHLEGSEELIEQSKAEFYNLPIANDLAAGSAEEEDQSSSSRRDFLKYAGFSLGAATIAAGCKTPVRRAMPYTEKPDTIVPGIATYYASHFMKGGDFCPVLVKTREGRPIKLEGNKLSPLTEGATTARAQASVLELYDTSRYQYPVIDGDMMKGKSWSEVAAEILPGLASKRVAIISNTNLSFSENKSIQEFLATNPNASYHVYDPISSSALVQTHMNKTGKRGVPFYDFSKAKTIVSIGADFLGTWVAPAIFAKQFSKTRNVKDSHSPISHLIAVESTFSLTGSNADDRIQIRPSQQGAFITALHGAIAGGGSSSGLPSEVTENITKMAAQLRAGNGLVVSNSNNLKEQELIAEINEAIGAYGTTITPETLFTRQGLDSDIAEAASKIKSGSLDAVIFVNDANPVYDSPFFLGLEDSLDKIPTRIALNYLPTETSSHCNYVLPIDHTLEAWNDIMPSSDSFGFVQPTINRLFDTRSVIEFFAGITASIVSDQRIDHDYIKNTASSSIAPLTTSLGGSLWTTGVHDGVMTISGGTLLPSTTVKTGSSVTAPTSTDLEMVFTEPLAIGSGAYANNPWLQEMPDPITRVVWDNPLQVPIKWNTEENDFVVLNDLKKDGFTVEVGHNDQTEKMQIVRQFGLQDNTIGAALGYGRSNSGKVANDVGVNLYKWLPVDKDGNVQYFISNPTLSEKVGMDKQFASVQHHHTYGVTGQVKEGGVENVDERKLMTVGPESQTNFQGGITDRSIIRHSTVDHLDKSIEHLKHEREHHQHLNDQQIYAGYDDLYANGHHWGLSIDLTKCIGCAACQVACIAENNVPVVGKREVSRHHEMTWMRIDRYYYGDANNPSVVYQPMMCQHCDNAPCENVCPVNATNHSSEGLNQMTYNRCIGTRYCANNCPYKVRRFNWLDYTSADTFGKNDPKIKDTDSEGYYTDNLVRMVLNPDVMVRSRGVIEKCSFCVQKIQEGKLTAKKERRPLHDGDIRTACQLACPTDAIVFGDMNDKESEVSKKMKEDTTYLVLEETNVRPSVYYQMKVQNKQFGELHADHEIEHEHDDDVDHDTHS